MRPRVRPIDLIVPIADVDPEARRLFREAILRYSDRAVVLSVPAVMYELVRPGSPSRYWWRRLIRIREMRNRRRGR